MSHMGSVGRTVRAKHSKKEEKRWQERGDRNKGMSHRREVKQQSSYDKDRLIEMGEEERKGHRTRKKW